MSTKDSALVVGGEPRVNLLPPEVAQRKKARGARRGLVALVIIVLLAVAGAYAFATVRALAEEASLAASQAKTAELFLEQMEYNEVTVVSSQLQAVKRAREQGVFTEVRWNELYELIRDRLPAGTTFSNFVADGRAPWEPAPVPAGPLRQPRVATITFIIASAAPFAIEPFVESIAEIPGFADVTPDVLERDDATYLTTFTYNLGMDALTERFSGGASS